VHRVLLATVLLDLVEERDEHTVVRYRFIGDLDKNLHLAVGHLQEAVDAGHPHNERLRILKRPTTLAGIHPGEMVIPPIDEVKREIERTTLDPVFIIYTPVASIGVRAPPTYLLGN